MEDINKKAHDDELNKSKDEIGNAPRKFIGVPTSSTLCIECGRLFDSSADGGTITHNGYICKQCLK